MPRLKEGRKERKKLRDSSLFKCFLVRDSELYLFPLLPLPPSPLSFFLSFFLSFCNRFATDIPTTAAVEKVLEFLGSGVQAPFFQVIMARVKYKTTFPSSCSSFLTKLLLLLLLLFVAQLLHPDESLIYNRQGFLGSSSSSSSSSQDLKWVDHCGQGWYCTCMCLASQLLDDSFLLFVRSCCLFDLTYYHFGLEISYPL
jgi:hypothetical protein